MKNLGRAVQAIALALTVGVLAGCSFSQPDPGPSPSPEASADSKALGLVNLWRVSGAEGEGPNTWLRLDGYGFDLWRDCGIVHGSWRASESMFLAYAFGASRECNAEAPPNTAPTWLKDASSYRQSSTGWELLNDSGKVVAALEVSGAPKRHDDISYEYNRAPEITDEIRSSFRRPQTLPATLEPVPAAELQGEWTAAGAYGGSYTYLNIHESGNWSGSDGCNRTEGRWASDGSGALLGTSGLMTAAACPGMVSVGGWLSRGSLAGMDGDELVLLDGDAVELGRLVRVTEQTEARVTYLEAALDEIEESRNDPDAPAALRGRALLEGDCGSWAVDLINKKVSAYVERCMRGGASTGAELAVWVEGEDSGPTINFYRVGPDIDGIQVFVDATRDNFGSRDWHEQECHPAQLTFPPEGC